MLLKNNTTHTKINAPIKVGVSIKFQVGANNVIIEWLRRKFIFIYKSNSYIKT